MSLDQSKINGSADRLAILIHRSNEKQIVNFLTAEHELSPETLIGYAQAILHFSLPFPSFSALYDCCGTGGDDTNTINISTATAILGASAGIKVAKHGNRGVSSSYGSADLLEAMKFPLNLSPDQTKELIESTGFGFLHATLYHPLLQKIGEARKKIATKTIFNLLGPLTNPVKPYGQLVGVYDPTLLEVMAETLYGLGCERALVIYGEGLDELSPCGKTEVAELRFGQITCYSINPTDFGYEPCSIEDLRYAEGQREKEIFQLLSGKIHGPKRAFLELNTGAFLYLAGKAITLEEGVVLADELLQSGQPSTTWNIILNTANQISEEASTP